VAMGMMCSHMGRSFTERCSIAAPVTGHRLHLQTHLRCKGATHSRSNILEAVF
jgi:hypothetical protein